MMKTIIAAFTGSDRGTSRDASGEAGLNESIGTKAKLSEPEVVLTRKSGVDAFAIEVGGTFNHMDFELRHGEMEIFHTFVHPSQRGGGLAAKLAEAAIAYAEEHGLRIVPTCQFMAKYMQRRARE